MRPACPVASALVRRLSPTESRLFCHNSLSVLQAAFPAAKEVFDSLSAHPEITEIKFGRHKVSRDFYDSMVVGSPVLYDKVNHTVLLVLACF